MAVLGATSLTGCNSIPSFIPAGTLVLYKQTTAPTSWTKQTTHDNKALRVVSGTASSGGTTAFTSVFTSRSVAGTVGSTTLTTTQIPGHQHPGGANPRNIYGGPGVATQPAVTGAVGGGGSHNHTFTGTAQDFAVKYVDVIIASKN
jgi:hypothetical protein